ncbi:MAG: PepSY-associated TM helix domain-containing protein [Pseudomonadota bacterium]
MNKRKLWKVHSVIGLVVALPLLLIAITGSVLVFKHELRSVFSPEEVRVSPTAQGRLDWDRLHDSVRAAFPDYHVVGWHRMESPRQADEVYLIEKGDSEWLKMTLNPYTAEVLAAPQPHDAIGSYFLDWLVGLHYTFLAGHLGMLVGGIIAILLCAMGILGFCIYRQFWVGFFTLRWGKSWRVLMGDMHSRLGVLSSVVFLILGITGAYWNLTHAWHDITEHGLFEHEEEPLGGDSLYPNTISLSELVDDAQTAIEGYEPYYLSFPRENGTNFNLYGAVPSVNFLRSPYGSVVTYDHETGERLASADVRDADGLTQTVDTFYRLHYGTFGGLAIKVLWCVLGLAPALLALSGGFVWWRRRRPSRRRVGR